jgi:hypothetical protein
MLTSCRLENFRKPNSALLGTKVDVIGSEDEGNTLLLNFGNNLPETRPNTLILTFKVYKKNEELLFLGRLTLRIKKIPSSETSVNFG